MAFDVCLDLDAIPLQFFRAYTSLDYEIDLFNFRLGLDIWKKYQHLFPSKKYLLAVKKTTSDDDLTTVYFVNRSSFTKIVEKHQKDFERVLGRDVKAQDFFDCLARKECDFDLKLGQHTALLGIVLGYGRDNAWLYYNWMKLRKKKLAKPSLNFFSTPANPVLTMPTGFPGFCCNPNSSETNELRKEYAQTRLKIYEAYQKGDFLETTLKKLCE